MPDNDAPETKVTHDAILAKMEEMLETLGKWQFAFVMTYIWDADFRRKVYEEKKLRDADMQEEISSRFGDPETAKLIWRIMTAGKRKELALLSQDYLTTVDGGLGDDFPGE